MGRPRFLPSAGFVLSLLLLASYAHAHHAPTLSARAAQVNTIGNTTTVVDPTTGASITQAPATDGAGIGLDPPAIVWLAFCAAIGTPLALAGVRLGRITTALGCALISAAFVWTALVNTVSPSGDGVNGIPDLVLDMIVLGTFLFAFTVGLFRFARLGGLAFLAIAGGGSVGLRITIIRAGLLFSSHGFDWGLIIAFAAGGFCLLLKQRLAVVTSAAACGSFLLGLAVDLVLSKQDGMSRGLRFLLDRDSGHLADFANAPYAPTNETIIIAGVSIALIPALAYFQHLVFKSPFYPVTSERPGSIVVNFEPDLEAGLKQPSDVNNPEFYRRRGLAPPATLPRTNTNPGQFASWRASMGNKLRALRGGQLDDL